MEDAIMSRILFLDIDGVLNSNFWNNRHQVEISDGTLIDEEKIKLLAYLLILPTPKQAISPCFVRIVP